MIILDKKRFIGYNDLNVGVEAPLLILKEGYKNG